MSQHRCEPQSLPTDRLTHPNRVEPVIVDFRFSEQGLQFVLQEPGRPRRSSPGNCHPALAVVWAFDDRCRFPIAPMVKVGCAGQSSPWIAPDR